jgi:hypothetical protein
MQTWRVAMWDDDGSPRKFHDIKAKSAEAAEERASLDFPNFDNYEAELGA